MLKLQDNNGNPFPDDVQKRVNDFIDSLKHVHWFKPNTKLERETVDTQAKFTLKCFGVEAGIEYRKLQTPQDWGAARDAAWDAARDAARDAAWDAAMDAARDAAWDAARGAARDAAWDAAMDAARGAARDAAWGAARDAAWDAARDAAWDAAELIVIDKITDKYPDGAFIQLFKLWEMGLYPVGVLKETATFVIYVPPSTMEFPF